MTQIKEGYKETEVGVIPEDWKSEYIKNLVSITTGNKNTQDKIDDGLFPFYVRSQKVERINEYGYDCEGVITAGDGVGTGKIFHYVNGKFALHQRCYLMSNFKGIDAKYFYWIFSNRFYDRVSAMTAKSSVDSVRREMIADMEIPFPKSLPEQQKIATALSDIDSLISSLEEQIQKKKNIKQGAMQQLLTGKCRLPGFAKSNKTKQTELGEIPEDWEVKELGKILKIGHGRDYKYLSNGDIPVYGTGGYMCSVNKWLYDGPTVCIGRKGTIDKPLYHEGKIWTVDTLFYTYEFKSINPKFLYYKFCLIDWLSMNEASGVPSLTSKNIEDIQISVPEESEQLEIAKTLTDMDDEINELESKLSKYRELKTGMMQQLLTGKIRLV